MGALDREQILEVVDGAHLVPAVFSEVLDAVLDSGGVLLVVDDRFEERQHEIGCHVLTRRERHLATRLFESVQVRGVQS